MPVRREDVASRLYEIDPFEFEHLIADIWDYLGWDTEVTSKAQDGGIDVVAR